MAIRLYQLESCPYCARVRQFLETKGLEYEKIDVPGAKEERDELERVSGQRLVPVLVDGDTVITDSMKIVAYLGEKY